APIAAKTDKLSRAQSQLPSMRAIVEAYQGLMRLQIGMNFYSVWACLRQILPTDRINQFPQV
ncbi:MAG TPA: hypothetical protein PLO50_05500, partial [Nitrospira sp.]|nr:hypothetical protein [Nitrospira sp.]